MNIPEKFEVIFEDEHMIAIHKPPGILVHPTRISEDTFSVLPILRDQIRQRVYPIHRLDRGTSGLLIFGKNKEAASFLNAQFRMQEVEKEYIAVIRGHVKEEDRIDYPLAKDKFKEKQEAITDFYRLSQTELDFAISRYPSSRYSLVRVLPKTGKFHQIRRHFAHIRHPVLGDKKHGDCKHNKYFRENLGIDRMLLHASKMKILPYGSERKLELEVQPDLSFKEAIQILNLELNKN